MSQPQQSAGTAPRPSGDDSNLYPGIAQAYSPLRLLLVITVAVILSEVVSFFIVHQIAPYSDFREGVLDPLTTTLLIFPFLYFFAFRPIRTQVQQMLALEDYLRQSEANFRGIIEDQTEFICQFYPDGKIAFVNQAFCRTFGDCRDLLQGQDFISLFCTEEASSIQGQISTLDASRPLASGEYRLCLPDGEERWTSWTFRAVYRGKGELLHYQAVGRDITDYRRALQQLEESRYELDKKVQMRTAEMALVNRDLRAEVATRRSAEIALQASESHLRQIISQLPAVLWTTDQSLELTSLMGTRLAESQAQLETLLRTDLKQLAQAGDFSRPVVMAHAGALHGRRTEFELECGGLILQCMVEPFRGLEGDIKGCLGVALDITARKRSDETISRQHAALEAAADGIMITDENGLIQWANPAMTAITGFPVAELLGRTPAVFQSGRHSREFYATLWGTIRSGRVWQGETYNRRKDGRLYVEDQTITPVKDASGKILNFIAIKHDITSRKKAEEEITRRNRELQALRDAGVQLTQSLEPDVVFQTMLGLVEGLVPDADRITLYLQVEDGLQLIGVRGKASRSAAEYPALLDPAHHPLIQSALETLENRLIHDTTSEPLWAPLLDGLETRAFLGVPLQLKGNTLGICCLESETPGCFSAQETHLVEALLGQAAVAVQNARLYQVVRDGRERLQQLSRRLVDVQEMERRYIARELHDDTSQALVGLVFALEVLKRDAGDPQAVAASVTELDHLISDILDNLHRLAVNLRPAALDHLGLIAAIRQYVDGLREKYHLAIHLAVPELPSRLPQEMETTLYRIIQEALANVVLHARASTAEVRLELLPGQLRALIADDGIGFNLDEALAEERLGLFGMRERAEMLGGSLAIDSAPGAGTRISLEVPCEFSNPDRG